MRFSLACSTRWMIWGLFFCLLRVALGQAATPEPRATVMTTFLRLSVDSQGNVTEFIDRSSGKNYAPEPPQPVASVKKSGQLWPADRLTVQSGRWQLTFGESGVGLAVQPEVRDGYLKLTVVGTSGDKIEELTFLDIPLTLRGDEGEPFSACALALNLQTNIAQLPRPTGHLRAICYPQFGMEGAAAAIVASPPAEMRRLLQDAVTDAPDLPHSPLGGPWALDAPTNRGSYLFNFDGITDESVHEWIALAQPGHDAD